MLPRNVNLAFHKDIQTVAFLPLLEKYMTGRKLVHAQRVFENIELSLAEVRECRYGLQEFREVQL